MFLLEKQCFGCKEVLPIEMFSKDGSKKDGLKSVCRPCIAKRKSTYYYNGGKEKIRSYVQSNPVLVITSNLTRHARKRAQEKNLPFDIDIDYVRSMVGTNAELASHCPVFKMPLEWSCRRDNGGRTLPNSPSIDRIDPARGYVKGNIWVISHRANTIKNNASHEELKLVAKATGIALVNSLEF